MFATRRRGYVAAFFFPGSLRFAGGTEQRRVAVPARACHRHTYDNRLRLSPRLRCRIVGVAIDSIFEMHCRSYFYNGKVLQFL